MATPTAASERMNRPGGATEAAARVGEPARALLAPGQTPAAFLHALVAAGHLTDAVRVVATVLPRREAAWWAVRCVRTVPAALTAPKAIAALDAAEKWIINPTDEARRAAFTAAEAAGFGTPAGCVGTAVFLSEGSLAPPNLPVVAPATHLAPAAAANAAILASVIAEPERAAEKLARFVALGREVAAGTNRWAEAKKSVPPPTTALPPAPRSATMPPPPPWRS